MGKKPTNYHLEIITQKAHLIHFMKSLLLPTGGEEVQKSSSRAFLPISRFFKPTWQKVTRMTHISQTLFHSA